MAKTQKEKRKEIGNKIARQLKEIESQEKAIRALEKEKEVRDKNNELKERIKALKKQRPTFFRKVMKVGKGIGRVGSTIGKGIGQAVEAERKERRSIPKSIRRNKRSKRRLTSKSIRRNKRRLRRKSIATKPQRNDLLDFVNSI